MKVRTVKNRINRELSGLGVYFEEIPLCEIFDIVRRHAGSVLDVDGTPWSGFLCGEDGSTWFAVTGYKFYLRLSWHKMPSGRYEVTTYVS